MAIFKFKLPDIGEGIAEAEIVAWHVAVGDRIEEDAQLADMMTDKATVEMESPVAGVVRKLAGEVGDQVAIGSVLVEIETEAEVAAVESKDEQPLGDGAVHPSAAMAQAFPVSATDSDAVPVPPADQAGREEPVPAQDHRPVAVDSPPPSPTPSAGGRGVLASPAVRQRARDLGIELGQVKTTSDRVRHADLDAYLLYNGGSIAGSAPKRADETT
ncbi:MAG: E3 binding domain-containing protein, partial [Pseudomonadota bacterium]|nr:E3 binding domain-containing protein [Pseudomonadota bacterium]